MNLVPPSFPGLAQRGDGTVAGLCAALGEAAGVVATLAGVDTSPRQDLDAFARRIQAVGGWRLARAETALDDLTAIMERGLAALLSVNMRGADPRPAARALLAEFDFAYEALLALLPPPESTPSAV